MRQKTNFLIYSSLVSIHLEKISKVVVVQKRRMLLFFYETPEILHKQSLCIKAFSVSGLTAVSLSAIR